MRNALTTLALGLTLSAIALAKPYMDRDTSRNSGVSGIASAHELDEIDPASRALALRGFGFTKGEGRTCSVIGYVGPLPDRQNTQQYPGKLYAVIDSGHCYPGDKGGNDRKFSEPQIRDAGNYFVNGVKVCTQAGSTSERSIRGIKIFYAKVKTDGTVIPDSDPEVWINSTGCEKWEEKVMCPDGMIAVGYRAHKDDWGYRALGLKCSPVAYRDND